MMVEWDKTEYTDAPTYYREVVMAQPRRKGIIFGGESHLNALAMLTRSGLFVVEADDDDIYVDDWKVNGDLLAHKHPEFGEIQTGWTKGVVEAEVYGIRRCTVCDKQCPGEINMMHKFYQL